MKIALAVTLLALLPLSAGADTPQSFFDFETHTLMGEEISLQEYAGKVCLVVNVASKCGLTPQYKGLQALYEELGGDDFTILAFPSNDFQGQEPGTPEEIATFCQSNYGVTFPMFEKVKVTGKDKAPIYRFLTADLEEPSWNFTKYLVDRDGKVLHRFDPRTAPDDEKLRARIDEALGE
jgi:glutathione peroxidase